MYVVIGHSLLLKDTWKYINFIPAEISLYTYIYLYIGFNI